jgi:hypothetical protein
MRVIVIGAGPMGIAAAAGATARGFDVTVLERGDVGATLRTWGPTRFFSPLHMNVSPAMRTLLGDDMPPDDALLTGSEYVDQVLMPIAERLNVLTRTCVVGIGRRGMLRGDYAGHPLRAERPFRIVCEGDQIFEAEVVLDASGGLVVPRAVGAGGLPARGEATMAWRAIRTLGELAAALPEMRNRSILLLGDGHSAANAIGMLDGLAREAQETRVTWAVRSANRRPCDEVLNDPLPEREAVVSRANALAEDPPPYLRVERRAAIESLARTEGRVRITLSGDRVVEADYLAAFTGYRPDASFVSELALEISPVTEGGARLYRAVANVTDCLTVPRVRPQDLESGEPGYYFVGSRAYGRSTGFLLQSGLSQLETILENLCTPTSR